MDALTIVLILLVLAVIWLVVELVLTVRRARPVLDAAEKAVKDADDLVAQAKPVVAHVDEVVTAARPGAEQVTPVLAQTSSAIEALSDDLRRLDAILGDVSRISKTAGNATTAVGDAAESLATKARGLFSRGRASRANAALADGHGEGDAAPAAFAPTYDDVDVAEDAEAFPEAEPVKTVGEDVGYFTYPEK